MSDKRNRVRRIERAADAKAPPEPAGGFRTLMVWSDPGADPAIVRIAARGSERFVTGEPGESAEALMGRLASPGAARFVVAGSGRAEE